MENKKELRTLSPEKKKLAKKIHHWAFLDAKKHSQKFTKQFEEIWHSRYTGER